MMWLSMSCSWRPHCYNTNLFSSNLFLQDQLLLEEIIPNMVNDSINNLVTLLPSKEEIKNAVFFILIKMLLQDLMALELVSFKHNGILCDVVDIALEFFTSDWLLPNFSSNTCILIPKSPNVDSIDKYKPFALANFKFKLFQKSLLIGLLKFFLLLSQNNKKVSSKVEILKIALL